MTEVGINLICLGLNIRRWRRGMRLTQAELAAKVGAAIATSGGSVAGEAAAAFASGTRLELVMGKYNG